MVTANKTPEQRKERKRELDKKRYELLTPEQREQIIAKQRKWREKYLENETPEQREQHLARQRERNNEREENMTPEQREQQNQRKRDYMKTYNTRPDVIERRRKRYEVKNPRPPREKTTPPG
jgi:hypothetical protein